MKFNVALVGWDELGVLGWVDVTGGMALGWVGMGGILDHFLFRGQDEGMALGLGGDGWCP